MTKVPKYCNEYDERLKTVMEVALETKMNTDFHYSTSRLPRCHNDGFGEVTDQALAS